MDTATGWHGCMFLFQSYAEYFCAMLYILRRYPNHQHQAWDTGDGCIRNPVMAHSPWHQESLLHTSPASFLLKYPSQMKAILMANNDWTRCWFFFFKIKLVSGKDHWHCPHPGECNGHSLKPLRQALIFLTETCPKSCLQLLHLSHRRICWY